VNERKAAERATQKAAEGAARATCINEDTVLKTFNNKLSSYKHKDDLITITDALGLPMEGTVASLMAHITSHLDEHLDLVRNPWFTGLFG
jgi:hypothetical protein